MPTIRKATRGAEFLHGYGTVRGGDTIEVDADTAEYLVDQDGYERVADVGGEEVTEDRTDTVPVEDAIEQGVCPWCDDYSGDGVPQHASSAHPEKWAAYSEADG